MRQLTRSSALLALTTGLVATFSTVIGAAHGASVTVPGAFPGAETALTYVPCDDFFGKSAKPQLKINRGPATAPMGERSYGMSVAGTGTAAGVMHRTNSMASMGAVAVSVIGAGAREGVAWSWYAAPDLSVGKAWLGRADLSAPGSQWSQVSVSKAAWSWQKYDLVQQRPLGKPVKDGLSSFVGKHGDGAGYVVAGFGCNGSGFNFDAFSASGDTFDFEGIPLTASIALEGGGAGGPATITGSTKLLTGAMAGNPMVLQSQAADGSWSNVGSAVLPDASGTVRATVNPQVTTSYRWHVASSEYSPAADSDTVTVQRDTPTPSPTPAPEKPSEKPTPTAAPSESPKPESPKPTPTVVPTSPAPSPEPSVVPSEPATEKPAPTEPVPSAPSPVEPPPAPPSSNQPMPSEPAPLEPAPSAGSPTPAP